MPYVLSPLLSLTVLHTAPSYLEYKEWLVEYNNSICIIISQVFCMIVLMLVRRKM